MIRAVVAFLLCSTLVATTAFARGGHGGGHARSGGTHGKSSKGSKTKTSHTTSQDKVHVNGYVTKEGKTVAPHDRTGANKTKDDNWSTKGNVNPRRGRREQNHLATTAADDFVTTARDHTLILSSFQSSAFSPRAFCGGRRWRSRMRGALQDGTNTLFASG